MLSHPEPHATTAATAGTTSSGRRLPIRGRPVMSGNGTSTTVTHPVVWPQDGAVSSEQFLGNEIPTRHQLSGYSSGRATSHRGSSSRHQRVGMVAVP